MMKVTDKEIAMTVKLVNIKDFGSYEREIFERIQNGRKGLDKKTLLKVEEELEDAEHVANVFLKDQKENNPKGVDFCKGRLQGIQDVRILIQELLEHAK
jgi:hypothetical protein